MNLRLITAAAGTAALLTLAACGAPADKAAEAPAATAEAAATPAATEAAATPAATEAAATPAATEAAAAAGATMIALGFNGPDGAERMGDPANGAKVFRQCQACHVLEPGQNRVGPTLHGIFGRTAGTVEGFKYSEANKSSGKVWSAETMFTYLENPRASIPGTIMAFAGLKKEQDRLDVIAYIKQQSKS
jgi:cytochrome c